MANKIKGDVSIVYIYDTTALAYKPVACLTSNSLSTSLEVIESNTKCDPGVTTKEAGNFSYSISLDGEYIDTTSVGGDTAKASHDYLLQKQKGKEKINWKLSTGLADTTYFGTAFITDLSQEAPVGETSTFSATLDGTGDIVEVDPI